jgi:type IV secretion system protein VirB8
MKTNTDKANFEKYLQEARSWETDKVTALMKSRKTAWWVAGASGIIAFAATLAVAALVPLKSTEPYVIRVDNSTGAVDVVQAMKDGKTNYDEALNKYFVQWYIRYREGYAKDLAEAYYSYVGILSNGVEQQKYFASFNPKNPASPLNVYGSNAKVTIDIQSTSFINPNVALVRYIRKVERGLDQPLVTHWAATITFKYLGAPMKESDRGINPLGFQVTEYRNDPDAAVNNVESGTPVITPTPVAPAVPQNVVAFPTASNTAPAPIATPVRTVPAIQP